MKRTVVFVFLCLLLCAVCAAAAADDERTSGDFRYNLRRDGTAELLAYTGDAANVIIPNALEGHPVTAVRGNPFYYHNSYSDYGVKRCTVSVATDHPYLATIDGVLFGKSDYKLIFYSPTLASGTYAIPRGIRTVGDQAFYDCDNLTGIVFPDTVQSIGTAAFRDCGRLTSVAIPRGITAISNEAFRDCTSLSSVTIPDTVTAIGEHSFESCTSLRSVTIPGSVTSIGYEAFRSCDLRSVEIPKGVTSLGTNVFSVNRNLTEITIPESVTEIPSGFVFRCSSLPGITIPPSVRVIGGSAFEECVSFTEITIPEGVTEIANFAFVRCENLTSLTIPDSVTRIGQNAFDLGPYGEWYVNPNLVVTVSRGSVGESYCISCGIRYTSPDVTYGDDASWLDAWNVADDTVPAADDWPAEDTAVGDAPVDEGWDQ